MLTRTVELFLEKYDLLKPKNNIIVAFSGGYDSICLLNIMKYLAKKYELNLFAIHLNHNWRGKESDAEEENCRQFASDINFYCEKLPHDIPHTETAAREERYKFFEKCAQKFNSSIVLTAHNANDNAETVFYRALKGTGLTGLAGIKEHRDIYYRPLLGVYREQIEAYCRENNLKPNIDSSNFNTNYARNKIRYEIFPKLKEISPEFEQNLNKISKYSQDFTSITEKMIKKLENYTPDEFSKLNPFLQNIAVHKFLQTEIKNYDRKKIEEISRFIIENKNSKSGKTYSLDKNKFLFVNDRKISSIIPQNTQLPEIHITKTGVYKIGNFTLKIEKYQTMPKKFPEDSDYMAFVSFKTIDFTLRQRKAGDMIQPLGMNGTQKLKKYLISKQIPKYERGNLVFLCQNNEILWAPGIGLNEKIKVVTVPTHVLKLERR